MKTKGIILTVAAITALAFLAMNPIYAGKDGKVNLQELGLKGFVQEEFDYTEAMHELYRHYEFANACFTGRRYDASEAHLRVMEFYVNLLPMVRLDKKFVRNDEDKKKFDKFAEDLIANINKTLASFEQKKYEKAGIEISTQMTNMCKWCHKNIKRGYKDPTKFGDKPDYKDYKGGL